MEELKNLQKLPSVSRKADGFSRQDVVNAFASAFQMIGGVSRLALWANKNESDFYKLYGRLLPSATVNIGIQAAPRIIHALRPSALDIHPGQLVDLETGLLIPEDPDEQVPTS